MTDNNIARWQAMRKKAISEGRASDACEVYIVLEYVASITSRQLYKIADVDGTIYGTALYAAALANPETPVFVLGVFNNEISAKAKQNIFTIKKQRNVHEITFRAVGKITLMWQDNPAPFYPNECPEDDEMGILHPRGDWMRYRVGGIKLVSTSLPESISKEQWQKR